MKLGGRPRVDPSDESVRISATVPARGYDRLYREARRDEVSVAEVIRRKLVARTEDDEDDD